MSVTGAILAGVGAAGSIGGAAIASHGANAAAQTQSDAALQAANLQHQDAQSALDFDKLVYGNQQAELAPYLATGNAGLANLGYLTGILKPGGATSGTAAATATPMGAPTGTAAAFPSNEGDFQGRTLPQKFAADGTSEFSAPFQPLETSSLGATAGTPPSTTDSLSGLSSLINTNLGAPGSLLAPYSGGPFAAPTGVTEQNDPGYQFRLDATKDAVQRSAAARGGALTSGTAKDIADYVGNTASAEYGNVYNRALSTYDTNYNSDQQYKANTFNRLAALAGVGQTATQQLGSAGQAASNTISNTLLTSGAQIGQDLNNAGAARASGYAANGNIWAGALNNTAGSLNNLLLLSKFGGGSGGSSIPAGGYNIPDSYYGY